MKAVKIEKYIQEGQQKNWPSLIGKETMQFEYLSAKQPMATSLCYLHSAMNSHVGKMRN
jgi:hypothetical protein